jgi:phosphoribosylformylglycinamidine (FGAM) synthase PurS component
MWALHHEDDHTVDDENHCVSHWTTIRPKADAPQSKRVKGKWYDWCEECRGGKGQWSMHMKGSHWKSVAPKGNEPLCKVIGDCSFYWCNKCRRGRGMWARHDSNQHQSHFDSSKQSVTASNGEIDNLDYQGDVFSQFRDSLKHLLLFAKNNPKTVPNSCHGSDIQMCIKYHIKGSCIHTCKRGVDHGKLTTDKVQELYEWCQKVIAPEPTSKSSTKVVNLPFTFEQIKSKCNAWSTFKKCLCHMNFNMLFQSLEYLIGKKGRIHKRLMKETKSSKIQYIKRKKRVRLLIEHKDAAKAEQAVMEVCRYLIKCSKIENKKKNRKRQK